MKLALRVLSVAIVVVVSGCTGAAEEPDRAPLASSRSGTPSPAVDASPDVGAVGVGESEPEPEPERREDRPATAFDQLLAARDDWTALGLQDYEFMFQRDCFCPPEATGPFHVVVADGTVSRVDGEPVAADQDLVPTVPQLHDRIEQDVARGALVRGGYNRHGLPINLYVDPTPPRDLGGGTELPIAIDDEVTYTATLVTEEP